MFEVASASVAVTVNTSETIIYTSGTIFINVSVLNNRLEILPNFNTKHHEGKILLSRGHDTSETIIILFTIDTIFIIVSVLNNRLQIYQIFALYIMIKRYYCRAEH